MATKEAYLSIIIILTVFASTTAVAATLTGFANFGTAQGQVDNSTSSLASSLTPEQKDAICNPNNPLSNLNPVNTTESKICGLPVTVKPHPSNTTTATTGTGTETPSVVPTPPLEG